MSTNAREYQREYQRRRRAEDPEYAERQRQMCRDYHNKNREAMLAKSRKYHIDHAEKRREYAKRYAKEHPEKKKVSIAVWRKKNIVKVREATKEWNKNNQDKLKRYRKEAYKKTKLEVLGHYSNGVPVCSCCGEPEIVFLSIDHINGGGTKHRKELLGQGKNFYRWLKINGYPSGYRVLCHNCNQAYGHYGFCPHQVKDLEAASA